MAFPTSPVNGQTAIINNVYYSYVSATNTWTRLVGVIPTLSNLTVSGAATVGSLITQGNILPSANIAYDIGSTTQRFRSLYLSGNTIDLAGATIKTDTTTGAIALIAQPTLANPNPTGIVISPSGTLTTVATVAGTLTASAFSSASNTAVSSNNTSFANLTVSTTANVANLIVTNGVFWANGVSAIVSGTSGGTITMNQPSTLIVPFTGNARYYPTRTVSLKTVYANLGATPTGGNLGFTILKNGSNIGYGFTITTSSAVMTPVDISSSAVSLTTSDYLTINLTGNIAPPTLVASDLSVKITYS
jgi:hypothetical protein